MPQPAFEDHRLHVEAIVRAAISAVDPVELMARAWWKGSVGGTGDGPIVIGAGKGAAGMFRGLIERCECEPVGGVIAVPPGQAERVRGLGANVEVYEADHPLPTARNVTAARAVAAAALRAARERRTLIVLLSGGASAHLTWPAEGLTLDDLRAVTNALLRAGASIDELNCVRKHCERLKGGGMARLAQPAPVRAFILSDVVGDKLDVIASGPVTEDRTTFAEAIRVIERFGAQAAAPVVTDYLRRGARGEVAETVKPGDKALRDVDARIIARNDDALLAATREVERMGFKIMRKRSEMRGEARVAGLELARWIGSGKDSIGGEGAAFMGGETTVSVRGAGAGGRNQELVLWGASALAGVPRRCLGSFATDGIDGPTDAAGAYVTGETVAAAAKLGLDSAAHLANNDSHTFFLRLEAAGVPCLIRTGPTGTNVNDVMFGLAYRV
jgi:glycerate 2-kinase